VGNSDVGDRNDSWVPACCTAVPVSRLSPAACHAWRISPAAPNGEAPAFKSVMRGGWLSIPTICERRRETAVERAQPVEVPTQATLCPVGCPQVTT